MSTALEQLEGHLQQSLGMRLLGMHTVIHALTVAIVARGHVLIQGPPGLGKTLLSKSLAAALGGSFRRIQGTADLMPADIIGVHVHEGAGHDFVFHPGPLFANVLLFDEINRTSPKTQSALLEAMQERQVSADRHIYPLPEDFFVIATQNPLDFEGTYPLPESQLDRFMLRLDVGYPKREDELAVLERYSSLQDAEGAVEGTPDPELSSSMRQLLATARAQVDRVHIAPALSGYVVELARASREHPQVSLGLSTRGALALLRAARVTAAARGADYVSPDDVKTMWPWVVPHRLMLSSEALLEGTREQQLAERLLEQVTVPR